MTMQQPKEIVKELNLEQLQFEYDQLRKEILQNESGSLQSISFIILLSTAIMGFSFSQVPLDDFYRGIMLYTVSFINVVGMILDTSRLIATYIIGAYVKVFLETKMEVKWETRLDEFRTLTSKYQYMSGGYVHNYVFLTIIAVNYTLGTVLLSSENSLYAQTLIPISVALVAGIMLLIIVVRDLSRRSLVARNNAQYFYSIWNRVSK